MNFFTQYWPYTLITLVIAAVIFALILSHKRRQKRRRHIHALTKEMGLRYDEGNYLMKTAVYGIYEGISVNVFEERRYIGYKKRSKTYTLYNVSLIGIDVPKEFALYREDFATKIIKLFGGQDIQINDPELDKSFIIRGQSIEQVRTFLAQPDLKPNLLKLHKINTSFTIKDNALSLEFEASITDHYRLLRPHITLLVNCAKAMKPLPPQQTPKKPLLPEAPAHLTPMIPLQPTGSRNLDNTGNSW